MIINMLQKYYILKYCDNVAKIFLDILERGFSATLLNIVAILQQFSNIFAIYYNVSIFFQLFLIFFLTMF